MRDDRWWWSPEERSSEELVANFPPVELFESFEQMGKKGRKFTLSAKENRRGTLKAPPKRK